MKHALGLYRIKESGGLYINTESRVVSGHRLIAKNVLREVYDSTFFEQARFQLPLEMLR